MPPQIGFDIDDECVELPPPQYTFFVDEAACDKAKRFLIEFFTIYDSGNRQPLEMAYHDQALFSLTTNNDKTRQEQFGFYSFDSTVLFLISLQIR